ncbi:DUF2064 domain-containing protein [uncultured Phycicoccus sp.]|uniref:TIGR04282 family arsenosugar biosynthesis glycosyltransferase n=1 Tax=uncultured Phycicoccus sp. TaxID=661422 RepID=UPI00260C8ADC|nr:DUF2064 domain-containing protein [uncultured Phycicoccus sp.]
MRGSVLVLAKAPVAGRAKTRLAADLGDDLAAELAAASLLDTLEAGAAAYPPGRRVLALAGDLHGAACEAGLRAAAADWLVIPQTAPRFADRIVDGHRQAHRLAGGPVVQIGMDTPQVHAALLRGLAELAHDHERPVLGPAVDGGWWVLVTTQPAQATVLAGVPLSRADTGRLTASALEAAGHPPVLGPLLRDVDEVGDADEVAAAAPHSRFARLWREHAGRAGSQAVPVDRDESPG